MPTTPVAEQIAELYAFVMIDDAEDCEKIPATTVRGQDGAAMAVPLIATDYRRAQELRPLAMHMAKASGRTVKLVRFSKAEDLEVIGE